VSLCHNPAQNRVYVANSLGSSISVLRDSGGGVEETENCRLRSAETATIIRGMLHLRPSPYPLPVGEGKGVRGRSLLLDAAGRKVLDLLPGPNDVRHLAPGVYFVREPSAADGKPSAIDKVVIAR